MSIDTLLFLLRENLGRKNMSADLNIFLSYRVVVSAGGLAANPGTASAKALLTPSFGTM